MNKSKLDFEIVQLSEQNNVKQCIERKEIYRFLMMLNLEYPGFRTWYKNLYVNDGCLNDNREILICKVNNSIAGVSILKSDVDEKKICTFRIKEKFQRNGIGKALMEKSFEKLNTDKPLITIHKSKEEQFDKLFKHFGFKLEQQNKNYYGFFKTELAYNGELPKKQIWLNKFEIANLENEILKRVQNNIYEEIHDIINMYLKNYNFQKNIIK